MKQIITILSFITLAAGSFAQANVGEITLSELAPSGDNEPSIFLSLKVAELLSSYESATNDEQRDYFFSEMKYWQGFIDSKTLARSLKVEIAEELIPDTITAEHQTVLSIDKALCSIAVIGRTPYNADYTFEGDVPSDEFIAENRQLQFDGWGRSNSGSTIISLEATNSDETLSADYSLVCLNDSLSKDSTLAEIEAAFDNKITFIQD